MFQWFHDVFKNEKQGILKQNQDGNFSEFQN